MKRILTTAALLMPLSSVFALDAACEPIIESSEAKIAQPAWHSVSAGEGLTLEAMKVDGKFFMKTDDKWRKFPVNLDEAEKTAITQMREGAINITNCKDEGSETLEGMEMTVIQYTAEVLKSGIPAADAKLYLGKEDGLPYKVVGNDTTVTYRYKDVVAPK